MLSVTIFNCYPECHNTECCYAECHYAECHYAECHCAECHYAECHYAEHRDAKAFLNYFVNTNCGFRHQSTDNI